jgi:hypothetical protein
VKRLAAGLAGVGVIVIAVVSTLGGALVTLLALAVALGLQRRRGRSLGAGPALWVAGITTTLVFVVAFGVFVSRPAQWASFRHSMAESERRPPPPPPAFLKALPGGNVPPPQLSGNLLAGLTLFSLFLGCQFLGAVFGALTWGGVWLLRYGVRGPRRVEAFTSRPEAPL